jgi:hypothetical protein
VAPFQLSASSFLSRGCSRADLNLPLLRFLSRAFLYIPRGPFILEWFHADASMNSPPRDAFPSLIIASYFPSPTQTFPALSPLMPLFRSLRQWLTRFQLSSFRAVIWPERSASSQKAIPNLLLPPPSPLLRLYPHLHPAPAIADSPLLSPSTFSSHPRTRCISISA